MGEVYRARDARLGREVAIKVLPASCSQDADRLHRFEHEARAAGVLNHPNVTAVYDIGSADGSPYVVTELFECETSARRPPEDREPCAPNPRNVQQPAHGAPLLPLKTISLPQKPPLTNSLSGSTLFFQHPVSTSCR
jgi:hypothetical protein